MDNSKGWVAVKYRRKKKPYA